jgi:hypothetical protein
VLIGLAYRYRRAAAMAVLVEPFASVYDDGSRIGVILARGRRGFEAYVADDYSFRARAKPLPRSPRRARGLPRPRPKTKLRGWKQPEDYKGRDFMRSVICTITAATLAQTTIRLE